MTTTNTRKLVADLRVLMDDAEDLVKATAAQTGDKANEVRSRIQQAAAEIKPRLARAEAALERKARAAAASADDFVHERPWTVIGVAAGVALLAGILAARR